MCDIVTYPPDATFDQKVEILREHAKVRGMTLQQATRLRRSLAIELAHYRGQYLGAQMSLDSFIGLRHKKKQIQLTKHEMTILRMKIRNRERILDAINRIHFNKEDTEDAT